MSIVDRWEWEQRITNVRKMVETPLDDWELFNRPPYHCKSRGHFKAMRRQELLAFIDDVETLLETDSIEGLKVIL